MADQRKEYVVEIGGLPHTFLLTEEDAKKYPGAKRGSSKALAEEAARATAAASEALTKSVTPDNK